MSLPADYPPTSGLLGECRFCGRITVCRDEPFGGTSCCRPCFLGMLDDEPPHYEDGQGDVLDGPELDPEPCPTCGCPTPGHT